MPKCFAPAVLLSVIVAFYSNDASAFVLKPTWSRIQCEASVRSVELFGAAEGSGNDSCHVVVLGGTGFVGTEVCKRLASLGASHVSTSTDGRDSTVRLDLASPDAEDAVADLVSSTGCRAVISTVGSIGSPERDEAINAASGTAAVGARRGGATKFIFIGNDPRVRTLCEAVPFLRAYAAGKEASESRIRSEFGPEGYCIVQPSFIYGGEKFRLNPPRVPSGVGQFAEELLGLYPVQALADALPDVLGAVLAPPVSRERAAAAAVNAALGLCEGRQTLEGAAEIIAAASKRPRQARGKEGGTYDTKRVMRERSDDLKRRLFRLGANEQEEAFAILEEMESLRPPSVRPVYDPTLNDRWDFVFDVEPDLGTGVIKKMLEDPSPLVRPVFDLKDVHMKISDNRSVRIAVTTEIVGRECEFILATSLTPDESDAEGTMVFERFEGMKLGSTNLPIPDSWKRSRLLEFSYLDEDMIIARGGGNEAHFLLRDKGASRRIT